MFGETRIEDLWLPFFALSSNLTRAEIQIHRNGPIWRAVRASCSIPGILPPVLENGELLVDGALLNNLPTDVMTILGDGGPVIAVDLRVQVDLANEYAFQESISTGELIWRRLNPFARNKLRAPNMLAVLTRSTVLARVQANAVQAKHATLYFNPPVGRFGLLDRKQVEAMYLIGYEYAIERIAEWQRDGTLTNAGIPSDG